MHSACRKDLGFGVWFEFVLLKRMTSVTEFASCVRQNLRVRFHDFGNQNANTCNADCFKSLSARRKGCPDFVWAKIPTTSGHKLHPFLLPHSWFQALFAARSDVWKTSVEGADGEANASWTSMQHTSFVREHPFLNKEHWPKIVPLGFHGDAGSFSHQDSLFIFSWNSLLATGTTLSKRFIFTVVKKSNMCGGTLDAIMEIFAWSMNV